jgi:hypothetical protein
MVELGILRSSVGASLLQIMVRLMLSCVLRRRVVEQKSASFSDERTGLFSCVVPKDFGSVFPLK